MFCDRNVETHLLLRDPWIVLNIPQKYHTLPADVLPSASEDLFVNMCQNKFRGFSIKNHALRATVRRAEFLLTRHTDCFHFQAFRKGGAIPRMIFHLLSNIFHLNFMRHLPTDTFNFCTELLILINTLGAMTTLRFDLLLEFKVFYF